MPEVNETFLAWIAGCFDVRGFVHATTRGSVRVQIVFPMFHQASRLRMLYGGSISKATHIPQSGANWNWVSEGRGNVRAFLQDVSRHVHGQITPMQIAFYRLEDVWGIDEARDELSRFYERYYKTYGEREESHD